MRVAVKGKGHRSGDGFAVCDVCGHRAIYVSEIVVDSIELRDRDRSGVRRFKGGSVVCNACLGENPEHSHAVRPLAVPRTRRVRRRRGAHIAVVVPSEVEDAARSR